MRYYDEYYEDDHPRTTFFRSRLVKRTQKDHMCIYCDGTIPQHSKCMYVAQLTEEDNKPTFGHAHAQCYMGYDQYTTSERHSVQENY